MQIKKTAILAISLFFVTGCSGQNIRENLYKGVYDGSRIENMRGTTPAENAGKPDVNYDQYQQLRQEQLKKGPQ